jgi:hypothetical protein
LDDSAVGVAGWLRPSSVVVGLEPDPDRGRIGEELASSAFFCRFVKSVTGLLFTELSNSENSTGLRENRMGGRAGAMKVDVRVLSTGDDSASE